MSMCLSRVVQTHQSPVKLGKYTAGQCQVRLPRTTHVSTETLQSPDIHCSIRTRGWPGRIHPRSAAQRAAGVTYTGASAPHAQLLCY